MAITLKKVSTGAGVFHQQTIVFPVGRSVDCCGHFDSWPATDGSCCQPQFRLVRSNEEAEINGRLGPGNTQVAAGVLQNRRSQAATRNRNAGTEARVRSDGDVRDEPPPQQQIAPGRSRSIAAPTFPFDERLRSLESASRVRLQSTACDPGFVDVIALRTPLGFLVRTHMARPGRGDRFDVGQSTLSLPKDFSNASFPPEAISIMKITLDAAVASLPDRSVLHM